MKYKYSAVFIGILLLLSFALTTLADVPNINMTLSPTLQSQNTSAEEIYIPAGEYVRGCTFDVMGKMGCGIESSPFNAVYIDAFYIDKLEVTNADYLACQNAGACPAPLSKSSATRPHYYSNPIYDHYPVLNVTWEYADAYCHWIGKRLPTEAEWEKAARGTDRRWFPWGNELPTCERTNTAILYPDRVYPNPCVGDTVAVGLYPQNASPYGVLDMVGNVREFVNDFYKKNYMPEAPYYNPRGPETDQGKGHLARGGGWYDHAILSSNWVRHDESAAAVYEHIGFRCARTAVTGSPTPTPTSSPTPTATPMPTSTPYAAAQIGPEGGAMWLAYPEHLTLLVAERNDLDRQGTFTLTYADQLKRQGVAYGINHFFTLTADVPGSTFWQPPRFANPLRLYLGYENGAVCEDTLQLYRMTPSGWTTKAITLTQHLPGYIVADIYQTGLYGLMGWSYPLYLPITLR